MSFLFTSLVVNLPGLMAFISVDRQGCPSSRSERPTLLFGRKAITLDERGDHSHRLGFLFRTWRCSAVLLVAT